MLTCLDDKRGLMAELRQHNDCYFDHPGYKHSGVARVIACQPMLHKYDNTIWFVVRRSHRAQGDSHAYRRSPRDMLEGKRKMSLQWQRYSVIKQQDYVVACADLITGILSEHAVFSSRDDAMRDMRSHTGATKRHHTPKES